jgi:hypothetical protein
MDKMIYERKGSLWVPKYHTIDRFQRYQRRFRLGFTHSQATTYGQTTATTLTLTTSLGNNPANGDVVCVGIITFGGNPTVTVHDDATIPNVYTKTASSPSNVQDATAGSSWLFYLIAGPTATKNIIVTLSANPNNVLGCYVDDFSVSGGSAVFDSDVSGNAASVASPTNAPLITPNSVGILMYSHGAFANLATGVIGGWTQNDHGIGQFGENAAYIINGNSPRLVQFTYSGTDTWDTTGMSFRIGGTSSFIRHPR